MLNLDLFSNAVIQANKEIIQYISNDLDCNDFLYTNITGAGGDISLNIDIIFENIFKKHLINFATIYSEENGYIYTKNKNNYLIILDPLDGSDNFLSSIPYFGSSVALEYNNNTIFGAICNFATKTITIKYNKTCYIYNIDTLKKQRIIINTINPKIGIFERAYDNPKIVQILKQHKLKFRSYGAIAIDLSYAFYVNFILFVGNIRDFDIKAGIYIASDLFIEKNKKFLLISKDKSIFNLLLKQLNKI